MRAIPRTAQAEAEREREKLANPKLEKPVFRLDKESRPWVPNSATWNGCFAPSDSSPSIRDTDFVPERAATEALCKSCFLIVNEVDENGRCSSCG
jgi:hypothetical protein